jgi:hypothetical protein
MDDIADRKIQKILSITIIQQDRKNNQSINTRGDVFNPFILLVFRLMME